MPVYFNVVAEYIINIIIIIHGLISLLKYFYFIYFQILFACLCLQFVTVFSIFCGGC